MFLVTLQKFNFDLRKNAIVTEHFITKPNSFLPNLKANNFA